MMKCLSIGGCSLAILQFVFSRVLGVSSSRRRPKPAYKTHTHRYCAYESYIHARSRARLCMRMRASKCCLKSIPPIQKTSW